MIPLFPKISFKLLSGRLPKGSWKRRAVLMAAYLVFLVILIAILKMLPIAQVKTFMRW